MLNSERLTLTHPGVAENALAKRRRDVSLAIEQISIRTGITENDLNVIENSMLQNIPQELVENAIIEKGLACQKRTLEIERNKRTVHEIPAIKVDSEIKDPKRQVQEVPVVEVKPENIIMFRPRENSELRKRLQAATTSEAAVTK